MKKVRIFYIGLFLCICLVPVLLMPVLGHQKLENDTAASSWPSLTEKGQLNREYFSQVSDYVDKNIALRRQLVSANGLLMKTVFQSSAQEDVIVGRDGFLFYSSSVDTFTGRKSMNGRQLHNAAGNLRLIQDILQKEGIRFVFTIAPNKNSLYGQYMPARYQADPASRSVTGLAPLLESMGVNYVDLFALFGREEEILYHRTDSHWNNRGAAKTAFALLKAADLPALDWSRESSQTRRDFQGDLFAMICPSFKDHEPEIYYDRDMSYRYLTDTQSNYDPMILTENPDRKEDGPDLVVFRDSFGNSLLPFLADQAGQAYFSRNMPINAQAARDRQADALIWEIVERNLSMVQEEAPVLAGLPEDQLDPENEKRLLAAPQESVSHNMMEPEMKEGLICIEGNLDKAATADEARVYVFLTPAGREASSEKGQEKGKSYVYQAFQTRGANGSGYGFCLYLDPDDLTGREWDLSLTLQDTETVTRSEKMRSFSLSQLTGAGDVSQAAPADPASGYAQAQEYIGKPIKELIAVIGQPLSSSTGPSCNGGGDDGQYLYEGFTVYTHSEERGGEQIIQEVLEK